MVIGHLGVAMAARARYPRVPLLLLVVVSVAPDIVDIALAVLHVCAPNGVYSHSIPAATLLAALCAIGAALWRRSPSTGAIVGAVVLLHLPADYITGLKVVWPGFPVIGLNLYSHPIADFVLEALLTFAGWRYLQARSTAPLWLTRWAGMASLLVLQAAMDIASVAVGPVKPNACAATPAVASERRDRHRINGGESRSAHRSRRVVIAMTPPMFPLPNQVIASHER